MTILIGRAILNSYDDKYAKEGLYWGVAPSDLCYRILKLMPPSCPLRVLDIGCGEGRNAVFFARNGYNVSGYDISAQGIAKATDWARSLGLRIDAFQADLTSYRLESHFDIIFSTGTLHYIPPNLRDEVIANIKVHTSPGGLNAFSVFVEKPFVPPAPDAEANAFHWKSGMLLGYYHDWLIELSEETIFECNSGGTPHKHAVNRIVARKL